MLAWPRPVGVTFADGSAECLACHEDEEGRLLAASERAVMGVVANSNDGELLVEGEP